MESREFYRTGKSQQLPSRSGKSSGNQENQIMKNRLPMKLTKTEVAEFSAVLGSAPVLTSESDRDYNEIWENLIVTFAPRDFMELLLIRQVQNETWRILRYTRHQTLGIDRRFRESLELQTRAQKEQAARRGALAKELAKQTGRSETELAQVLYLRGIVMSSVDDVDAILSREPTEIEHNKALEAGIVFQEQLDRLINSSLKRRNEAIEQLDFYRAGFGQRWREISDQILNAEATEIEEAKQIMAPTLTPRDEPSECAAASSVERGTDQTSKSADAAPIAENGGSR
jgi:hypothetical protein